MTDPTHVQLDDAAASDEATRQVVDSSFFASARAEASLVLSQPERLLTLASATARSTALRSGPFVDAVDDVRTMIRLAVAVARGHYVPSTDADLVEVVAALLYIQSPIDVIPDDMPMVGYLDDVAIVGWTTRRARVELDRFLAWELAL